MPTPIYHITHIRNLQSILHSGGLIANSSLKQQQTNYQDIAHGHIQDRRALTRIPCAAGGFLHDYVPFYFAPRSPMLYAIHKGNVQGYSGEQSSIIYLVFEAEDIEALGLTFAFTDGHAVMAYADFYDDLEALEFVIDWELMDSKYWFDTQDDPNRKFRRQAEFLVHKFCPCSLIKEIGVINSKIKAEAESILQKLNFKIPVMDYYNWYY